LSSFYEFIHSFRKDKDAPFPGIASDEGVQALKKMIEIKKTISSGK